MSKAEKGTAARRLEIEAAIKKLRAEYEDTTAAPAQSRILNSIKKLEDELSTYYND